MTWVDGIAAVFPIIVLVHNLSVFDLQDMNWWLSILLQDFVVDIRIHGAASNGNYDYYVWLLLVLHH